MTRITRDGVGLLIARAWSLRATCSRRKVGCLLVDADGYQLATGYNGPASGMVHCTDKACQGASLPSGTGLDACEAIHAEWNAIARCADVREIYACYVTSSPCITCTKMLMNTGCKRIVFPERYAHDRKSEQMWIDSGQRDRPTRSWELIEESAVILSGDDLMRWNNCRVGR
jgi:dCMP deaminase